jgi:hypothetical protein
VKKGNANPGLKHDMVKLLTTNQQRFNHLTLTNKYSKKSST